MSHSPTDQSDAANLDRYSRGWSATTAMVREGQSWSGRERNCVFLNTGGKRFANVSAATGLDFIDDGRSVARVDWDQDGAVDLWIANRTAPQIRFVRNQMTEGNHFLAVRLEGRTVNRDAIGARVELYLKGRELPFVKLLQAGESFLTQSSKWMHFGLGETPEIDRLVVHWPAGEAEEFRGFEPDRRYWLVQNSGEARAWEPPARTVVLRPSEPELPAEPNEARILLSHRFPMPRLDFVTFDGEDAWVGEASGGPVLINLWASWCQPCAQELREFAERAEDLRTLGIDVIALSVDDVSAERPGDVLAAREFLEGIDFPHQAGLANVKILEKLELIKRVIFDNFPEWPVPTSFLIDRDGWLMAIYKGRVSVDQVIADATAPKGDLDEVRMASLPMPGRWHSHAWPGWMVRLEEAFRYSGYPDEAKRFVQVQLDLFRDFPRDFGDDEQFVQSRLAEIENSEARSLLNQGDFEAAIRELYEVLEIDSNHVEARNNLGVALQAIGKVDEAITHLRTALVINPEYAEAKGNLAVALIAGGETEEALAMYREAIEQRPDWWTVKNNLAWTLATHPDDRFRNGQEALALAQELCDVSQSREPVPLDTLAAALAETGDFERAVATAEEAIALAEQSQQHELARQIEQRLRTYKVRQPYRAGPQAR